MHYLRWNALFVPFRGQDYEVLTIFKQSQCQQQQQQISSSYKQAGSWTDSGAGRGIEVEQPRQTACQKCVHKILGKFFCLAALCILRFYIRLSFVLSGKPNELRAAIQLRISFFFREREIFISTGCVCLLCFQHIVFTFVIHLVIVYFIQFIFILYII